MIEIKYNGEFSWDLTSVAPYAYWHEVNRIPYKTVGAIGSKPVYFFSENHTEQGDRKTPEYALHQLPSELFIEGRFTPNRKKWIPPPYKDHFKDNRHFEGKELLIINNKFTEEQGGMPSNYLNRKCLEEIIATFKDKYTIIYIRPTGKERGYSEDDNIQYGLNDEGLDVVYFNEYCRHYDYDFNYTQFMVCAKSERFISVAGGNSVICSYFGGENLVYFGGITSGTNEFVKNQLTGFSDCEVSVFNDYDSLIKKATELWG